MAERRPDSAIDTEEIKRIIAEFKAVYDDIASGYGSPSDVQARGNVTEAQLGGGQDFPAAKELGRSTANAYRVMSEQYLAFVNCFGGIVQALHTMVGGHEEAQQSMTQSINGVSSTPGGVA